MHKKIKPIMGTYGADLVSKLKVDFERKNKSSFSDIKDDERIQSAKDDIETIFDEMSECLNPDVCLNGRQVENLKFNLESLFSNHIEGGEDRHDEMCDRGMALLRMVNGYRLACADCLNDDCRYRDDNYPADEVVKRAKDFE